MNYAETYSTIAQQPLIRRDEYLPLAAMVGFGLSVIAVTTAYVLIKERREKARIAERKRFYEEHPEIRERDKKDLEEILPILEAVTQPEMNLTDWPFKSSSK